jgi:hypothetical protein
MSLGKLEVRYPWYGKRDYDKRNIIVYSEFCDFNCVVIRDQIFGCSEYCIDFREVARSYRSADRAKTAIGVQRRKKKNSRGADCLVSGAPSHAWRRVRALIYILQISQRDGI